MKASRSWITSPGWYSQWTARVGVGIQVAQLSGPLGEVIYAKHLEENEAKSKPPTPE